ncbi:hypothetical protein NMY22_g9846 [Coprinellus aureogranulatus]|nr:hypothetical protein NMY22_g9846 [Coprinellus aureogranulatus]
MKTGDEADANALSARDNHDKGESLQEQVLPPARKGLLRIYGRFTQYFLFPLMTRCPHTANKPSTSQRSRGSRTAVSLRTMRTYWERVDCVRSAFLAVKTDPTCKRDASAFLANASIDTVVHYIQNFRDGIGGLDEALQMSAIDTIRLAFKNESVHQPRYIRSIFEPLKRVEPVVKYEWATMQTTQTQNPAVEKAAASSLTKLVIKELDDNIKSIVLDRLEQLRGKHADVLERADSGGVAGAVRYDRRPDIEERRGGCVGLEEAVAVHTGVQRRRTECRQPLIQDILVTAIKLSECGAWPPGLPWGLEQLSTLNVVSFVCEVVERLPHLCASIAPKLLSTL